MDYLEDNSDLLWYVDKGLDWAGLARITESNFQLEGGFKDSQEAACRYRATVKSAASFAASVLAPLGPTLDREPPNFVNGIVTEGATAQAIWPRLREAGLTGITLPRELGGRNEPLPVQMITAELLARADTGTAFYFRRFDQIAMALLICSIHEGSTTFKLNPLKILRTRFAKAIQDILKGEAWGAIVDSTTPGPNAAASARTTDSTTPGPNTAGSARTTDNTPGPNAAASARTTDTTLAARLVPGLAGSDGQWRITGTKSRIAGGHGKYHLLLANTELPPTNPAGRSPLSLFLVPAHWEQDGIQHPNYTITHIEPQLGQTSAVTVGVAYHDSYAQLVGKLGEGQKLWQQLQNHNRIAAGFAAIGLCERAHRLAQAHAQTFPSHSSAFNELTASQLAAMAVATNGVRALAMTLAYHQDMAQRLTIQRLTGALDTEEDRLAARRHQHHAQIAQRLTPLLKYISAETAVTAARTALQIHTEFGYSKDCAAEALLRDALGLSCRDGSSQWQALAATKAALLAVIQDPRRFTQVQARAKTQAMASRGSRRRVAQLEVLGHKALRHLISKIAHKKFKKVWSQPLGHWNRAFFKDWQPDADFAPALLHCEPFTRLQAVLETAKILLKQADADPNRRELLRLYLQAHEAQAGLDFRLITESGDGVFHHQAGAAAATQHEALRDPVSATAAPDQAPERQHPSPQPPPTQDFS